MKTETPRDGDGAKACAWCGEPIRQSGIGRSKDYCRRSCRQRAYESRQVDKHVEKQVAAHRALWESAAADSSRGETRDPQDSSRDETRSLRDASRDESKGPGPAAVPAQQAVSATPVDPVTPEPESSAPAPRRTPSPTQETIPLPVGLLSLFGPPKERDADGE